MYAVDNSVAFDQIRIIVAGVPAASFIGVSTATDSQSGLSTGEKV
jgi:hypothetical protein